MSSNRSPVEARHVTGVIIVIASILYMAIMILHTSGSNVIVLVECVNEGGSLTIPIPYKPNDNITLSFTHSVHRTPQIEILEATYNGLYLKEVRFKEYGAGIPASPGELGGGIIYETGDFIVYSNLNMPLGRSLKIDLKNAVNMSIKFKRITLTGEQCDAITVSIAK